MVMPSSLVGTPARQPLPYGLFSTFTFRPSSPAIRWEGAGVAYETLGCGPLQGVGFGADWCADPATVPGVLPRQFPHGGGEDGDATPFTIVSPQRCSPVGNDAARARARAEERLLVHEERAVEHAFATAVLSNAPSLRGAATLTDAAVPFDVAVGLLEEYLAAEYGSQGIVHAPRSVVAASPLSTRVSGQTLRTALGTPVAAGAGYDGSGPDGTPPAAGTRWVYITPAITGYRSDPLTTDLFDRTVNDQIAYSERDYLLAFEDCGAAAALVAIGATGVMDPAAVTAYTLGSHLTV